MELRIGTRMRNRFTREMVVLMGTPDPEGFVLVRGEDGLEVPIALDHLVQAQSESKETKEEPALEEAKEYIPYLADDCTDRGLFVAFDLRNRTDPNPGPYEIVLINDTFQEFAFTCNLVSPVHVRPTVHGKLLKHAAVVLYRMELVELNDTPEFQLDFWELKTNGSGAWQQATIGLKGNQFSKKLADAPLLEYPVYLYQIADHLDAPVRENAEKDLEQYTALLVESRDLKNTALSTPVPIADVERRAAFPDELDLHIESLAPRQWRSLHPADILRLQRNTFEQYFHDAIRLGLDRIYIIHGVGKGTLRKLIHERLEGHPSVFQVKNEYHAKYGYGATEIIFK